MPLDLSHEDALPAELRDLVSKSGRILGEVIAKEQGKPFLDRVEALRSAMAALRGKKPEETTNTLRTELRNLEALNARERREMARAFTLFLELMNACENAWRTHRLTQRPLSTNPSTKGGPDTLVYVLTAHPTEARSPENIQIFQGIERILSRALDPRHVGEEWSDTLTHQLELAWRVFPTRERAPKVKDEADHIYHLSLRPEILRALLIASKEVTPVFLRTWVGGDKDGHPGVDAKATMESLALSRQYLLRFAHQLLDEVDATLNLLPGAPLRREVQRARKALHATRAPRPGDGARIAKAKTAFSELCEAYEETIHAPHPRLQEGKRLFYVFPGLVVPLELRESSDVLMSRDAHAIEGMLATLARISKGGEPVWYARGFIVSMTSAAAHLLRAETKVTKAFGSPKLPVIPLFETDESLDRSVGIVREVLANKRFGTAARKQWNQLEIMVGYSDSSKQGGVLPSRVAIARAMHALEKECENAGVRPVFFQGSGGSVDRGGGSVQEQVAWWPRAALRTYKVTIQGEMVERSLSNPVIARGQIERIASSAALALRNQPSPPKSPALFRLAELVNEKYRAMIHDPDFLRVVDGATPYSHLSALKIGSRPSRRSKEISVEGLRAIPWVLCWTQTRVLFQTWWGVGSAWRALSDAERVELKKAFVAEPVFNSYVKALAFTLAKVELPLWKIYLERGGLEPALANRFYELFTEETRAASELVEAMSGSRDPLWFRPWLGASIRLRSPIIHPLNLLQVLAMAEEDSVLFRSAATGISAGMMTTG
jgi:phosphoenolpyruvate carboxylase